ncbi:hypothetical protein JCM17478_30310 [Thermopirellula anaerolimosa]
MKPAPPVTRIVSETVFMTTAPIGPKKLRRWFDAAEKGSRTAASRAFANTVVYRENADRSGRMRRISAAGALEPPA